MRRLATLELQDVLRVRVSLLFRNLWLPLQRQQSLWKFCRCAEKVLFSLSYGTNAPPSTHEKSRLIALLLQAEGRLHSS